MGVVLVAILGVVMVPSASAMTWGSNGSNYYGDCGGDVDIRCDDPTEECTVKVTTVCVGRQLPSRPEECQGTIDHQCRICFVRDPENPDHCRIYFECALYAAGVCVLYRP